MYGGKAVDFGGKGYSDYTLHKDPRRMRDYIRRHGGVISERVAKLTAPDEIRKAMLRVTRSTKESWDDPSTPGFWSRWLLWSHPNFESALRIAKSKA
jgi:hypothetical protein